MSRSECPSCRGEFDAAPEASLSECPHCHAPVVSSQATQVPLFASSFGPLEDIQLSPEFRARYRLLRLLGAGAVGSVYLAQALGTGESVAVKFLVRVSMPETLERFVLEGRILSRIRHPNVVHVRDVQAMGENPYLIFEYVDGGTLRTKLNSGRASVSEAVALMVECLAGLEACHHHGIVHRDVKPENILLTSSGKPKLADLGIAKDSDATSVLTRTSVMMGTPTYMAPEQVLAVKAVFGSDIYSAGVILYEMLAGRPPFVARTPTDLVRKHREEPPPPLAQFAPEVPAPVVEVVERALAKTPDDRFARASDFATALEKALKGQRPQRPATRVRAADPPTLRIGSAGRVATATDVRRWVPVVGVILAFVVGAVLAVLVRHVVVGPVASVTPSPSPESPEPGSRSPSPSIEPPSPGPSTPPAASDAPVVARIRVLRDEIEATSFLLKPWLGGPRDGRVEYPLLLTCLDHASFVAIEPAPGSTIRLPDGVEVHETVQISPRSHGLVHGLNWLTASTDRAPKVWVRVGRDPCTFEIAQRLAPPPEETLFSRVIQVQRVDPMALDTSAGLTVLATAIPDVSDPFRQAAQLRVDLDGQDFLTKVNEFGTILREDDPIWEGREKLDLARRTLDAMQKAAAAGPSRWDVWQDLGWCLRLCDQDQAARAALVRALMIWPESYWSWRELGRLERHLWRVAAKKEGRLTAGAPYRQRGIEYLKRSLEVLANRKAVRWFRAETESELQGMVRLTRP